jgi:hypothetical protein
MFLNNCAIFNEECGELAFGVLGRSNAGDTKTADFNHLNFVFSNLRVYMNASQGMRASSGHSEFVTPKSGRQCIKVESEEVQAVTAHMKSIIRALVSNKHRMYDGEKEGYRSSAAAHEHQLPLGDLIHFLGIDCQEFFARRAQKVETTLAKGFLLGVLDYQNVWPELKDINAAEAVRLREQGEGPLPDVEEDFGIDHGMEGAQEHVPAASAAAPERENEDYKHDKHNYDKDEKEEDENADIPDEEYLGVDLDGEGDVQSDEMYFEGNECNSDDGLGGPIWTSHIWLKQHIFTSLERPNGWLK